MRRYISQRKARALKKRVELLERTLRDQRYTWAREYPGGTHLVSIDVQPATYAALKTARKLNHAVVVTIPNDGQVQFYALKTANEPT